MLNKVLAPIGLAAALLTAQDVTAQEITNRHQSPEGHALNRGVYYEPIHYGFVCIDPTIPPDSLKNEAGAGVYKILASEGCLVGTHFFPTKEKYEAAQQMRNLKGKPPLLMQGYGEEIIRLTDSRAKDPEALKGILDKNCNTESRSGTGEPKRTSAIFVYNQ